MGFVVEGGGTEADPLGVPESWELWGVPPESEATSERTIHRYEPYKRPTPPAPVPAPPPFADEKLSGDSVNVYIHHGCRVMHHSYEALVRCKDGPAVAIDRARHSLASNPTPTPTASSGSDGWGCLVAFLFVIGVVVLVVWGIVQSV